MNYARGLAAGLVGLAVLWPARPGGAQETKQKVFRTVSSEFVEKILEGMDIAYKKTAGKKEGTFFYDFERNNYKVRLGNHGGKDLWIDAVFNKAPLATINQWNVRAKFSRAVLAKEGDRETAIVEAQLDCLGGVTEGVIRQFIRRFDDEVREFDKFVSK